MSSSFRYLRSDYGLRWQRLCKSKELGGFKLYKLLGLPRLHRLHEVGGEREGRLLRGLEGEGRDSGTRLPAAQAGCGH